MKTHQAVERLTYTLKYEDVFTYTLKYEDVFTKTPKCVFVLTVKCEDIVTYTAQNTSSGSGGILEELSITG